MRKTVLASIVLWVLIAVSASRASEQKVALSGRVVDGRGAPVAGATVDLEENRFKPPSAEPAPDDDSEAVRKAIARRLAQLTEPVKPAAVTDAEGRFTVRDLVEGDRVNLLIAHDGHASVRAAGLELPLAEPLTVVLRAVGAVRGEVIDQEGAPVGGASVRIQPASLHPVFLPRGRRTLADGWSEALPLDVAGRFVAHGVPPGRANVSVQAPGYEPQTQGVEVPSGGIAEPLRFVLRAGEPAEDRRALPEPARSTLSGRVLTATGEPIAGAMVTLQDGFVFGRLPPATGADGVFEIPQVLDGSYTFHVHAAGHVAANPEARVTVAGRPVMGLVIEMVPGCRITGRVTGLEVRLLPGVVVIAQGPGDEHKAGIDGEGRFEITGLEPGTWDVFAWEASRGRQVQTQTTFDKGAGTASVVLDFASGFTLKGRVTVSGKPAADAQIELTGLGSGAHTESAASRWSTTNYFGRFEVGPLATGRYRISAQLPGTDLSMVREIELRGDQELNFELERVVPE